VLCCVVEVSFVVKQLQRCCVVSFSTNSTPLAVKSVSVGHTRRQRLLGHTFDGTLHEMSDERVHDKPWWGHKAQANVTDQGHSAGLASKI
jgi:hypothetical protein